MRYYKLAITDAAGKPFYFKSLNGLDVSSLLPNGQYNPAALDIEMDIPVAPMHSPDGNTYVKILGLGLADIGSASDLNDKLITIYGGMSKGLPLANPSQQGVLVKGKIFQAFGNWVELEQSVDLLLQPFTGEQNSPLNIIMNWVAGTSLESAIRQTLQVAFPAAKLTFAISPNLVLSHKEVGYYHTLEEFAKVVRGISMSINPVPNYTGVGISYDGIDIIVKDNTVKEKPFEISFNDLIGQPTWIDPLRIQAKMVLRGDLDLFQQVKMPPSLTTNTASASPRFQDKASFSGLYTIQSIHHYGSYRTTDGAAWNTTVELIAAPKS